MLNYEFYSIANQLTNLIIYLKLKNDTLVNVIYSTRIGIMKLSWMNFRILFLITLIGGIFFVYVLNSDLNLSVSKIEQDQASTISSVNSKVHYYAAERIEIQPPEVNSSFISNQDINIKVKN